MSLDNKKIIGAPFPNAEEIIRVTYDFDNDGGAVSDLDVFEAAGALIVELMHITCVTTCTSAGAAVLDIGKGDGGTEFKSDIGFATIAADAVLVADTAGTKVVLADGDKIVLGIETAALTAGKFDMVFKISAY